MPKKKRRQPASRSPDRGLAKLQPKLRMVRDADLSVNALRAERTGAVRISKAKGSSLQETCRAGICRTIAL